MIGDKKIKTIKIQDKMKWFESYRWDKYSNGQEITQPYISALGDRMIEPQHLQTMMILTRG